MTQITAAMVKDLRDKTGAGMMDAKKALVENNGDMEAAVDWLRTKGLAKAAKKSARTAAEGLVAVAVSADNTTGAVVELNSETDFVARNDEFQTFVKKVAALALDVETVEDLAAADFGNGKSVSESLTDLIAKIGENMSLRRMEKVAVDSGYVASYVHGALTDGMGKIGVLVGLETSGNGAALAGTGKHIAMHIAAANPQGLSVDSLDPAIVEREKNIFAEQARASGKPDNIIEKMMTGRIRKFYEESVLLEQTSMIDGENKMSKIVEHAKNEAGADVTLKAYIRMQLGEGIDVEEDDFAAEVAKMAS
jgi:elongation factor Ts